MKASLRFSALVKEIKAYAQESQIIKLTLDGSVGSSNVPPKKQVEVN